MAIKTPAPLASRAIYGYVLYVSCHLGLALYVLWAYIPSSWLRAMGITYFPDKVWAIAVPFVGVIAILMFGFCLYPAIIAFSTASLDSPATICDKHAIYEYKKPPINGAIPPIKDIHISQVCRELYGAD
uniref:Phosphatidylinositol N-acetylglucosaminyltransferase subunit P n=2 Tax=Amblyomma TaxID=6942 RepID=G3MMZ6_AMBMU